MTLPRGYGLVIAILAVSGSLVGLEKISAVPTQPGPVHVVYWEKWTGFEFDGIKAIVDDFNKSQHRIWVDLVETSDIQNKTMFAISAGAPPDVAGLFSPNVPQYADERAIIPLDEFAERGGIAEGDYIPAYWQLMTYSGHLWALPTTPASTALHFNRAMLRAAGFDPDKPPQTIEELDAMSDKLTVKKGGHLAQVGFIPSEPGWFNFAWGYYFGGRLWDGNSRITANDEGNIRAYDWIEGYSRRYGGSEILAFKSGLGQFQSPVNGFMTSQVAMEIQGVWMHNFITMFNKNLEAGAAPFPHPANRPDLANMTYVDSDVLVIPRGAKHPNEAFEFIKYVQRQDVMEKLCLLHQKNSPLTHISDHFWQVHKNPWIHLFDDVARGKNAEIPARIGIWPEYQQELSAAFDDAVLLSKSPKAILDEVQTRVQAKFDEYQARQRRRKAEGL